MELSWSENLSVDRRRALNELIRGREFTNQLQIILSGSSALQHGQDSMSEEDLIVKILRSFTEALAILNLGDSEEVLDVPKFKRQNSPCSEGRRSEESEDSYKSLGLKDRRGCHKRRRTTESWTKTTTTLVDDGHAWRKYGQKTILNAKFPRSYFRCTHKFDQGCEATKQVQRMECEPAMYQITYNSQHTCENHSRAPQIILDSIHTPTTCMDSSSSSILLSFDSNNTDFPMPKQDVPFVFTNFPMPKQEHHFRDHGLPSFNSYLGHTEMILSPSHHELDMDVMVGSFDFSDDVLEFDF